MAKKDWKLSHIFKLLQQQIKSYNPAYNLKDICIANQAAPAGVLNDVYYYTGAVTAPVFGIAVVEKNSLLWHNGSGYIALVDVLGKKINTKADQSDIFYSQNKFNILSIVGGYLNNGIPTDTTNPSYKLSDLIEVDPLKTYYLSGRNGSTQLLDRLARFLQADGTTKIFPLNTDGSSRAEYALATANGLVKVPLGAKYIQFQVRAGTLTSPTQIQFEEGLLQTTYRSFDVKTLLPDFSQKIVAAISTTIEENITPNIVENVFTNDVTSSFSPSDKLTISIPFDNKLKGLDDGVQNALFFNRPTNSTIDFIANDGSTPIALASISKIIRATAVNLIAFYNWYIKFPHSAGRWTCGFWLKKTDYSSGSVRLHIAWSPDLTAGDYAYIDIAYADIQKGASGTIVINGFSASWVIDELLGNWFHFAVKSLSYDATKPTYTHVSILPYLTGGTQANVPFYIFHPALVYDNITIDPLEPDYIPKRRNISIENLNTGGGGSAVVNTVKLILPATIETYIGDTLQIFKYNICNAFNPKLYNIQAISTKITGNDYAGDDYPRYWEYVTTIAEEFNVTFYIYDNNRVLLDSKTVTLKVTAKNISPASNINVMLVGDSLTFFNRIPDEFARVLKSSDAQTTLIDDLNANTIVRLAGKGKTNITFVGTQKNNYMGWVGAEKHEGYSGWRWSNFIASGSPFWIGGALNFAAYKTNNSISSIDVMYIGLAWNDQSDMTSDTDTNVLIANAKVFLRAVKLQMPSTKVYLWTENFPSMNGGEGIHPYGSSLKADTQTWKTRLSNIFLAYNALVAEAEFSSFVKLIGANAMFDSENMMQFELKAKNARVTNTEIRGKDDIHPSNGGFFQIADALVRSFIYNHLT